MRYDGDGGGAWWWRCNALFVIAPRAMEWWRWWERRRDLCGLDWLVQNDIKRVLAYSTVSQLGYMFLGLGVGAFAGSFI
jgi:hypothetical protein